MKLVVILSGVLCLAHAQQTFRVPLEVTPGSIQSVGIGIEIKADGAGRLSAHIPGGGEMFLERVDKPTTGVIVRVPGGDPEMLALLSNQFSEVSLKRSVGHFEAATYILGYYRS